MSLNGLDGAAVAEAHQAAQADAGGWFLLRYVNRDTIEVLSQGTGGVAEVRRVIEKYEEKSPLYGLVQYRRKKVVLKYVPEGTSRLLQVRLTVQFQSVLETLTPHDTVFSFTAAPELTESALGMSTMLLPSAGSLTSSSSSLRRRRLNEISEDVEEVAVPAEQGKENETQNDTLNHSFPVPQPNEVALPSTPITTTAYGRHELDELPASAVLAKALLAKRKEEAVAAAAAVTGTSSSSNESSQEIGLHPPRKESLLGSPQLSGSPLPSPLPSVITNKSLPATPEPTPPSTSEGVAPSAPDFDATSNILLGTTTPAVDPSSPSTPRPHTRHLSAAESDSISLWSSNVTSYSTVKPKKKKLGPRPHVEPTGRPKTSGTTDSNTGVRPVANLPTSIRVNNKSLVSLGLRPGSQQSTRSVPGRFATSTQSASGAPPLPSPSFLSPPYSPGDSHSALIRPASVTGDASTATPEKLRLMKALQLRKRNMLLAQRASATPSAPSDSHMQNASDASISTIGSIPRLSSIPSQEQLSNIEEPKLIQSPSTTSPTIMTYISEEPSTKASSLSEQDDTYHTRRSLSSATSSSLTPKALVEDSKTSVQVENANDVRPSSISSSSLAVTEDQNDPDGDVKSALAYLEAPPAVSATFTIPQTRSALETKHSLAPALTQKSTSPGKSRRLGPPEPLKLLPNGDTSASDLSEDDSLIDEIHNATVHEAKPISVARSPVTPIMSKGSSDRLREVVTKPPTTSYSTGRRSTATTPERGRSASGSVRSVSTALPQWPPLPMQSVQVPLTKKPTLGTGISKRIKALEVLRAKEASPPRQTQPIRETSAGTSAFSVFMKRSSFLLSQQQAPNASTENSPPRSLPATGPHYDPHSSNTPRDLRRPSADTQRPSHKGETISVTARIVREQGNKHPPLAPSSSYHAPLNLYRSPLIVEHEKHDQSSSDQNLSNPPRVKSPTKSERGRFSFSSHRSTSHTNLPRSESNHSKVSKASNYKRHGPRSISDAASIGDDKTKTSMTSRLMKRMSNLANSRNKNQSPAKEEQHQAQTSTAQDQRELTRENSISESLLHVVDIGDVNVQFPESFLWKRRFMRIDDQGFLIFSPPATEGNVKGTSRKYHLGDFKRPSLPDYEREEMAWSVLLDLKDGRCIQCACESRNSQQQVLQMLVDAHSAYHQLYGA